MNIKNLKEKIQNSKKILENVNKNIKLIDSNKKNKLNKNLLINNPAFLFLGIIYLYAFSKLQFSNTSMQEPIYTRETRREEEQPFYEAVKLNDLD